MQKERERVKCDSFDKLPTEKQKKNRTNRNRQKALKNIAKSWEKTQIIQTTTPITTTRTTTRITTTKTTTTFLLIPKMLPS